MSRNAWVPGVARLAAGGCGDDRGKGRVGGDGAAGGTEGSPRGIAVDDCHVYGVDCGGGTVRRKRK